MSRTTFSGPVASTNGFIPNKNPNLAVNATAALAADTFVASGYITSTSAGTTKSNTVSSSAGFRFTLPNWILVF